MRTVMSGAGAAAGSRLHLLEARGQIVDRLAGVETKELHMVQLRPLVHEAARDHARVDRIRRVVREVLCGDRVQVHVLIKANSAV